MQSFRVCFLRTASSPIRYKTEELVESNMLYQTNLGHNLRAKDFMNRRVTFFNTLMCIR